MARPYHPGTPETGNNRGMQRGPVTVVTLALGILVAACSPSPTPSPEPSPVPTFNSPQPVGTPLAGATELEVVGVVREACAPFPSPCGYGATLVLPGGESRYAPFVPAVEGGPLLLDVGLPSSLPPGRYAIAFETVQVSDVESPVPYDDGSMGPAPPVRTLACTELFEVGTEHGTVRVRVAFNGFDCTIRIRRR
jgi:hypothetical protein